MHPPCRATRRVKVVQPFALEDFPPANYYTVCVTTEHEGAPKGMHTRGTSVGSLW